MTIAQGLIDKVARYNTENFKEEIYLQTDRDIYIVGEMIWLKVYKLNAFNKKPDNVSKVVYIELLNHDGYPVHQIKLDVNNTSESTGFALSDTLSSGNYLLRAYTNWMKNYTEKEFAFRNLSIINPFHDPEKIEIPPTKMEIDTILFYPEGGSLISGIESKVGFCALSQIGSPQFINAAIVNSKFDTVCIAKSEVTGKGIFSFTPDHTDSYMIMFLDEQDKVHRFPLDKAKSEGMVLSLVQSGRGQSFRFKVHSSDNYDKENSCFILVKSASQITFLKEYKLGESNEFIVGRDKIPFGLSQVVINDQNGKLLSSRWIYNEIENEFRVNINLDKLDYKVRDKVNVDISVVDADDNPMEADLSVSVTKTSSLNENRLNINNRYNQVYSAGQNSGSTDDANEDLIFYSGPDFSLESASEFEYLPEIEGKILSGKLKDNTTDRPMSNESLVFSLVGQAAKNQLYTTSDSGDFHFLLEEYGLQEIVIQPLNSEIDNYLIELKPDFINSFDHSLPGIFYLDTSKLKDLNKSIISMQVENIYQPFRQNYTQIITDSSFLNFYGDPLNTIVVSDFIQLNTVREVIKEIVPYVYTRKRGEKYSFRLLSDIEGQIFKNDPLVLVDGVPYNEIGNILDMRADDLHRIDVVNLRYLIDGQIFDGILHFITQKGNLEVLDFDYSIFRQAYTSMSRETTFNSPDYSSEKLINSRLPDYRNTLYWNPDLKTQKNGVAQFSFYTSDEASKYTILIEGISPEGKTGSITKVLEVK
jgi:hypothetical protein